MFAELAKERMLAGKADPTANLREGSGEAAQDAAEAVESGAPGVSALVLVDA
jgi:hypothetical protein